MIDSIIGAALLDDEGKVANLFAPAEDRLINVD
jgi:hypothetical protein